MGAIEQRFEVPGYTDPDYTGVVLTDEEIARGRHRKWIGGAWETIGKLQLDFLLSQGLQPTDRVIDVGCGSFRAGRHLVRYLDPGHYYGIDANHSVLVAGYENELDDELRERLPVGNLRATDRFDVDFGVPFDVGIAQSVFTHVSLNHMRLCLFRVAKMMRPGGRFYVTFNEQPPDFPVDGVVARKRPFYNERNVYWYYRNDLHWAAEGLPWDVRHIGDWGHPRNQQMMEFTRVDERRTRRATGDTVTRARRAGARASRQLRAAAGQVRNRVRSR